MKKLVDRWRDLQACLQDGLLALEADVFRPLHEAAEIALRLDVLTNAKVARSFLKQGVDDSLDLGLLGGQRGRRHLLTLLLALENERIA